MNQEKTKEKKSIIKNDTQNKNFNPYFLNFKKNILSQSKYRNKIESFYLISEKKILPILLKKIKFSENQNKEIYQLAYKLAKKIRIKQKKIKKNKLIKKIMQEFTLSSKEGLALMSLSEALLRIPDKKTKNKLIKDKIINKNWKNHINKNSSFIINLMCLCLIFTSKLFVYKSKIKIFNIFLKIVNKATQPIIRKIIHKIMKLVGKQFVFSENIKNAIKKAKKMEKNGFTYSYDMLGEAAITEHEAKKYMFSYQNAIEEIGKKSIGKNIYNNPSISIKLSALHPRYCRTQYKRVICELYPRLLKLTIQARNNNISINIDAEESDRLELSLDLLKKLSFEKKLVGWNGIGFVVQAYQKRSLYVIDEIINLAKESKHRIMIRLVKGAYWDTEIKKSQIEGLKNYPVYTRKMYTDISYLACAKKLLSEPKFIYPQFATHNTQTLSSIYHMSGKEYYPEKYEFQCLYGMGENLYKEVVGPISKNKLNRKCRIYAPVGKYKTLLAYLVRRLLENGANTSFVNKISNLNISLNSIVKNPIQEILETSKKEGTIGLSHKKIPLPKFLFNKKRLNSNGFNLSYESDLKNISEKLIKTPVKYIVTPLIYQKYDKNKTELPKKTITNPANQYDIVGHVRETSENEINIAVKNSIKSIDYWRKTDINIKIKMLKKSAILIEENFFSFVGVLIRESGKTYTNAISEVREAIDFLRYYSQQAEKNFYHKNHSPLGIVICISPWNFPLAIFIGQISAALITGNVVIAKPSEQTPIIAMLAVKFLYKSGIPKNVLQMLPGKGNLIGNKLTKNKNIDGVIFTGSIYTAKMIQHNISGRLNRNKKPISFIAETGGLNAMIIDSSALTEQVVNDSIISAFDSAGQRCSAMRILCIQEEIAEKTITMLKRAMKEYSLGNPIKLNTDIGPVINKKSQYNIEQYINLMRKKGKKIYQNNKNNDKIDNGSFIQPTIIEIQSLKELKCEIFGPVLHILKYKQKNTKKLIKKINKLGYGLTFGIHTRIDYMSNYISKKVVSGNVYINRNMIGAVVGVQPFGGSRLSGTGPKAGGPLYIYKLLNNYEKININKKIFQSNNFYKIKNWKKSINKFKEYEKLCEWANLQKNENLKKIISQAEKSSEKKISFKINGPTGEFNQYYLIPHKKILCLARTKFDILIQLVFSLKAGCKIFWPNYPIQKKIKSSFPKSIKNIISIIPNWEKEKFQFDLIIHHGNKSESKKIHEIISKKNGPIIPIYTFKSGDQNLYIENFLQERVISVNTSATGGDTNLIKLN